MCVCVCVPASIISLALDWFYTHGYESIPGLLTRARQAHLSVAHFLQGQKVCFQLQHHLPSVFLLLKKIRARTTPEHLFS